MSSRLAAVLALLSLGVVAHASDEVQYAFSGPLLDATVDVGEVAALDVNGDGVLDLVGVQFEGSSPEVHTVLLKSLGDGLQYAPAEPVPDGLPTVTMRTGDLDGDGDEDVSSVEDDDFHW